jgi:hypothetical protein
MADPSKEKRNKALPQHEADALLLREKTARLKELRLAHQAANAHAGAGAAVSSQKDAKKKTGKPAKRGPSLSDWLATQTNEGRRS